MSVSNDHPNMAGPATPISVSDGLSALHTAVIQNNLDRVQNILADGEIGVDQRTPAGATPLMFAGLFGRLGAFAYLFEKGAIPDKKDGQGFSVVDYTRHLPFTEELLAKYQPLAQGILSPSRQERRWILAILKGHRKDRKRGRCSRHRKITIDPAPHAVEQEAAPQPGAQPASVLETRIDFLRRGKVVERCRVQVLNRAEFDFKLGRKSMGVIGNKSLAISGWLGAKAQALFNIERLLDNKTYSALAGHGCNVVGTQLHDRPLDAKYRGDLPKKGSFERCHAEKQLGVWFVGEAAFFLTGSREITLEVTQHIKDRSHELPPSLRTAVIELDHEPCSSCIDFLSKIGSMTGLTIQCQRRTWYQLGERPKLRRYDGRPVSRDSNDPDTFEYEGEWEETTGLSENDENNQDTPDLPTHLGLSSSDDGSASQADTSAFSSRRAHSRRAQQKSSPSRKEKRGSPVLHDPSVAGSSGSLTSEGSLLTPESTQRTETQTADPLVQSPEGFGMVARTLWGSSSPQRPDERPVRRVAFSIMIPTQSKPTASDVIDEEDDDEEIDNVVDEEIDDVMDEEIDGEADAKAHEPFPGARQFVRSFNQDC